MILPTLTIMVACLGALMQDSTAQNIQDGGQLQAHRQGQPHVVTVHTAPTTVHKRAVQQPQHVVQNHHQVQDHPKPHQQQYFQPQQQYHQQQLSPEHQYLLNRYYRQYLQNAFYNPFQQPQYRHLFVPYNHDVANQKYFSRSGSLQENTVGDETPYDPTGHGDPAFSFYNQK